VRILEIWMNTGRPKRSISRTSRKLEIWMNKCPEDTEVLDMEEMEDMADMEYTDTSDNNFTTECYFTQWLMISQLKLDSIK